MTNKSQSSPETVIDQAELLVADYAHQIRSHPIADACGQRRVPLAILRAFARCQYVDSTTWVAMLALAKGKIEASALREAVRKNIRDEVGDSGTPHVTLCKRFLNSIGETTSYSDIKEYSPASVYPVALMFGLAGNCSDALMGGWLLSQEILVPVVFQTFRPSFDVFDNADVTYLVEHEQVDADAHSQWIRQAVGELVVDDSTAQEVITGVHFGGRATVSVLDYLYAQLLQMGTNG